MTGDGIELGEFGCTIENAARIFGESRGDQTCDGVTIAIGRRPDNNVDHNSHSA